MRLWATEFVPERPREREAPCLCVDAYKSSDASEDLFTVTLMPPETELLTPPEAAVVASVTVRDVNRVIDERILPERFYSVQSARRLHISACPLVGFYFHSAKALTAEEWGRLIIRISERLGPELTRRPFARWRESSRPTDWTVSDGFLTVNLWEFATRAEDRHAMLAAAREIVVEDPHILSGTPVIRGTRIPVHDVAASVAAGLPREAIRESYPSMDDRSIDLATIYAEATPLRGRPKRIEAPPGAKLITRRKVPRRKVA